MALGDGIVALRRESFLCGVLNVSGETLIFTGALRMLPNMSKFLEVLEIDLIKYELLLRWTKNDSLWCTLSYGAGSGLYCIFKTFHPQTTIVMEAETTLKLADQGCISVTSFKHVRILVQQSVSLTMDKSLVKMKIPSQLTFTCSKSTIETVEKRVKCVQS